MGTNSPLSAFSMLGLIWEARISSLRFGATWALFDFFVANVVAVEALRADSDIEVAKFLFSEVDLDCAVFGLFNAGSEGLCLILLILQQLLNVFNIIVKQYAYYTTSYLYLLYRVIAFVTLFSISTAILSF